MVAFPRLASTRRNRVESSARWVTRALAALGATGACLLCASPAAAVVTEVEFEAAKVKAGIAPRNSSTIVDGTYLGNELNEFSFNKSPELFANPLGHPVVHGAQVYLVYWDPTNHYHGDWRNVIDTFMHEAGGEPGVFRNDVFALDGQYTDISNKPASAGLTFRGAYTDDTKYPTPEGCVDPRQLYKQETSKVKAITCLSDKQVQTELKGFISSHALPTGMRTIYDILTPPGVTVCLDGGTAEGHCSDFASSIEEQQAKEVGLSGRIARIYESESFENSFCSYHSDINPGGLETGDANTILYDVIPWTAGGVGDGQLAGADQREEYLCQDGGFDPTSKPIELKELTPGFTFPPAHGEHPGGEAEWTEWGTQEKEAWLRAQEPAGPHVEEPNQVPCPSPDGFCDTGLADLIINQIAAQQEDTVTDPLLNSWKENASGNEAADECRNWFAPASGSSSLQEGSGAGSESNQTIGGHSYYLNTSFNLAALKLNYPAVPCLPGMTLDPKFTAPSAVNPEEVVTFDGMESDITMGAAAAYEKGAETPNYATFSWTFGDGTPAVTGYAPGAPACEKPWLSPCAASVTHAYKYGGTYEVTLTATDVAGNTASTSHLVTVVGPPPPPAGGKGGEGGEGGGGSGTGGSGTSGTSGTGGTGTGGAGGSSLSSGSGSVGTSAVPTPVVSELVLSKSLRAALKHGLSVSYTVSEQIAGRFEVLLPTSLARHLHLSGAPAIGLAAGTPAQTVIGKAIIVTTKGGAGRLTIQFSAATVKRLRHMHSVALIVRLVVHNAHAKSAIAIAAVSLSH